MLSEYAVAYLIVLASSLLFLLLGLRAKLERIERITRWKRAIDEGNTPPRPATASQQHARGNLSAKTETTTEVTPSAPATKFCPAGCGRVICSGDVLCRDCWAGLDYHLLVQVNDAWITNVLSPGDRTAALVFAQVIDQAIFKACRNRLASMRGYCASTTQS